MSNHDDVQSIALSLPEPLEEDGNFRFTVRDPAKALKRASPRQL